jgi:hypothetical protein
MTNRWMKTLRVRIRSWRSISEYLLIIFSRKESLIGFLFYRELLEQDDEAALKFHQGVVQGELRKKRKNRFGVEDSDDEDEEDDRARRIRRKMREKVERGDIQELGMILLSPFTPIYSLPT